MVGNNITSISTCKWGMYYSNVVSILKHGIWFDLHIYMGRVGNVIVIYCRQKETF